MVSRIIYQIELIERSIMSGRAVVVGSAGVGRVEAPVTMKAYFMCAFSTFRKIFFGYDRGFIDGVMGMPYFIKQIGGSGATSLSGSSKSLITSVLSLRTFVGKQIPCLMCSHCVYARSVLDLQ
jgi:hypothetical protein